MKILIVDDVATVRSVLRLTLEARGHQVLEATDGVQALLVLDRETVDGVVSDVLMPNMDGFRLCYEIRRNEKLRTLPFVTYTETYTSAQDQRLAKRVGADKYLLKSASADAIIEALSTAQRAFRPTASPVEQSAEVLREYSETLVNKLEKRNVELQQAFDQINELNLTLEKRVTERTAELTKALSEVKELAGLLPICSYCKRIRDDKNYWHGVETYISRHSKARFNHGICPDCMEKHVLPMLNAFDVTGPVVHELENR